VQENRDHLTIVIAKKLPELFVTSVTKLIFLSADDFCASERCLPDWRESHQVANDSRVIARGRPARTLGMARLGLLTLLASWAAVHSERSSV